MVSGNGRRLTRRSFRAARARFRPPSGVGGVRQPAGRTRRGLRRHPIHPGRDQLDVHDPVGYPGPDGRSPPPAARPPARKSPPRPAGRTARQLMPQIPRDRQLLGHPATVRSWWPSRPDHRSPGRAGDSPPPRLCCSATWDRANDTISAACAAAAAAWIFSSAAIRSIGVALSTVPSPAASQPNTPRASSNEPNTASPAGSANRGWSTGSGRLVSHITDATGPSLTVSLIRSTTG